MENNNTSHNVAVEFLTPQEGRKMFDRICRERMGISGQEFVDTYKSSVFECRENPTVEEILMLLPFWGDVEENEETSNA